jgi:hypothetical protein
MGLIKKYGLIVLLCFLIVILIFLKIKYSNRGVVEVSNNQTSQLVEDRAMVVDKTRTTPTIDLDTYEDESVLVRLDNLEPYFPYQGEYFRTERYLTPGYLEVIVKSENELNEAMKEVESWLREHQTDPQQTQCVYVFK